jgi:hypothetical protein
MALARGAALAVPLTIWAVHVVLAARLGAAVDVIARILLARPRPKLLDWNLLAGAATTAATRTTRATGAPCR